MDPTLPTQSEEGNAIIVGHSLLATYHTQYTSHGLELTESEPSPAPTISTQGTSDTGKDVVCNDTETPASEMSTDVPFATPVDIFEYSPEEPRYQCLWEACDEVYTRRCDLK